MKDILAWISHNYEWVFSGIGVFVLGIIVATFKKNHLKQNQKSGNNSQNIQVGGNVGFNKKDD